MADETRMQPRKWQEKPLLEAPSVADIDLGKLSESNPWFQYLAVVPPEDRARVAQVIGSANVESPDGFIGILQSLLVELFRGSVHPDMISASKPLLDHMYAVVALKNTGPQQSQATFREFTARMVEVKQAITLQPVQAHYTVEAELERVGVSLPVKESAGG